MVRRRMSFVAAAFVVGLALAGRGLDDLSGFVGEPSRPIGLLVAAVGAALSVRGIRFRVDMKSEAAGQEWLAVFNLAAFAVALWLFPFVDRHATVAPVLRASGDAFRWTGVVLLATGQALGVWAIQALGRWFTPRIGVQHGHRLVTKGPYRFVRHPFYTGLLMTMAGFPAAFGSWVGIAMVFPALPIILYRVRVEERELEREFGDDYREMRRRTRWMIPYVY